MRKPWRARKIQTTYVGILLLCFLQNKRVQASTDETFPLEKDLALLFDVESRSLVTSRDQTSEGTPFFPKEWYTALQNAYTSTAVGNALQEENSFGDWRVVSARVTPCQPLGLALSHEVERFCWPEVRLVWQPVVFNARVHGRNHSAYPDDRAVHTLYEVPAEIAMTAEESRQARSLLTRIRAAATANPVPFAPLSPREINDFEAKRNRVVAVLLGDLKALREPSLRAASYQGIDLRPELFEPATERSFRVRWMQFLSKYATPSLLSSLTSFSLPEGRAPFLADEWVFLSFQGKQGNLVPEDIVLRSPKDGRVLFNFGRAPRASMLRDDPALYDALEAGTPGGDTRDLEEMRRNVFLFANEAEAVFPLVRDRRKLLVPNTSCASCHKMNKERFDFHNLSYLDDLEFSVSPRVEADVSWDLSWLKSQATSGANFGSSAPHVDR